MYMSQRLSYSAAEFLWAMEKQPAQKKSNHQRIYIPPTAAGYQSFTAVAMCCFAFSTIIGWGLYGTRCIEFLFGTKANKPFMVVYSLVAIVGATTATSEYTTMNGLFALVPNKNSMHLVP